MIEAISWSRTSTNRLLDESEPIYHYQLTQHLTYHPSHVLTLALIKRGATLDPTTPLATQLHFLNLFGGEETPYESLHAVVSCGIMQWFNAFVGASDGGKEGGAFAGKDTRVSSDVFS